MNKMFPKATIVIRRHLPCCISSGLMVAALLALIHSSGYSRGFEAYSGSQDETGSEIISTETSQGFFNGSNAPDWGSRIISQCAVIATKIFSVPVRSRSHPDIVDGKLDEDLVLDLSAVAIYGDCGSGDPYYFPDSQIIEYHGLEHDSVECRTCYYYCIINNGARPNTSHTLFGDTSCAATCIDELDLSNDVGEWEWIGGEHVRFPGRGSYELGEDGSTGYCGLKSNESVMDGNPQRIFICVDGIHEAGTIIGLIKAGRGFDTLHIPGPTECEGTCDSCGTCSIVNAPLTPVCPGEITTLEAQIDGSCLSPVYSWTVTGSYSSYTLVNDSTISVTAGAHCDSSYTVEVSIDCEGCFFSPLICSSTVTVRDTMPPTITCPVDVTIDCSDSRDPANTGQATGTDNCTGPTITYSDASSGSCPEVITRTWTAEDSCGNVSTCVQMITIEDNTAPVINCPSNLTLDCVASVDTSNTGSATATDDCSGVAVTYSDSRTGSCPEILTRTWTAEDSCGNVSTCVQTITLEDNTPPTILCPFSMDLDCAASTDTSQTGVPSVTDDCSNITLVYFDRYTGSCPEVLTRTWTATDECGNESTCAQIFNLIDQTAPVLNLPADVTISCTASTDTSNTGSASATDDCSGFSITYSDSRSGSCPEVLTRTWTATDDCGNSSSADQIITIEDNVSPNIEPPIDLTIDCSESTDTSNTGGISATDNCSG
ncbi:MAG: hypothetical protein R3275_12935, partial [Saprospiraceae bacterium]|nr:hypothetical protein [Saprospiraceae bacterium]